MFDVAIYGHLVFDEVHNKKFFTNIGGIANVWNAFKSIDPTITTYVCPVHFGKSKITINENVKHNDSNLNLIDTNVVVRQATISHVAYVNELNNTEFIQSIHGIKTADLCTTGKQDKILSIDLASQFDIIFVAFDQKHLVPESYENKLVVHGPTETVVYHNQKELAKFSNVHQFLSDINVLGAGDYFAACYIYGTLYNRTDEECAEMAQILTTKFLKDRHEKA